MPDHSQYELDYRPRSYWVFEDPALKALATVKGALRRETAAQLLGNNPAEPLDPRLMDQSLTPADRYALFCLDPEAASGEFLPDLDPFEVEIARVYYESTFSDVVSVRARWLEGRIIYGVLDDYSRDGQDYVTWNPSYSDKPLTMREIVQLMDTASQQPDDDPDGWFTGLVQGSSRYQYYSESFECPPHFDRRKGFTSVSSAFYPELSSWYDDVDEELCEEYKQKAREELNNTHPGGDHGS